MLGTNTYGNYKSSQELQELWKWNTQEKSVQGGAKVMVRGGERVVSKLERRGWVWNMQLQSVQGGAKTVDMGRCKSWWDGR